MQPPPPENAGDKATWRVAATEARRPGSTARLPPGPRVGTRRTPALPAPRAAAAPAGPTTTYTPRLARGRSSASASEQCGPVILTPAGELNDLYVFLVSYLHLVP